MRRLMEVRFAQSFEADYRNLPKIIQTAVDRKLFLLLKNFRHPSLRAKKMEGYRNIWEVRVSKGYRFTFNIVENAYLIRRVGVHDILRKP